jgi:CheY-like chemotaxis protein
MNANGQEVEHARLVRMLAHEFRGYVREIALATGVSRHALERGLPTRANLELDKIDERVRDLAELFDLLQEACGHAVVRRATPTSTGLLELIESAFERSRRTAAERGIALTLRTCPDVRVELDVAKARQLISLVAARLLDLGTKGTLHAEVEVVPHGRGRASISLSLARRWAPGGGPPTEGFEESASLKRIIARLETCLGAKSGPRLPVADGAGETLSIPARLLATETRSSELDGLEGERLLVVEDDRDARSALLLLLEDCGFEVVEASRGDEGVQVGLRSGARLALLDIELPGSDGFQVRDQLRARDPHMPVIFLSGSERHRMREDSDPATRYLMKPVELNALESALRELLLARREREARVAATPPVTL